jgi:hypothetical protein
MRDEWDISIGVGGSAAVAGDHVERILGNSHDDIATHVAIGFSKKKLQRS